MVGKKTNKSGISFGPLADRAMMVQLEPSKHNTIISRKVEKIEKFYSQIEQLWKNVMKHEVNITMEALSAKVGRVICEHLIEEYEYRSRLQHSDQV